MKTWEVADSKTTEVAGFDLAWLPPSAYRYVTPRIVGQGTKGSVVMIDAGPYVGALPLLNGDTLYVVPKSGRQAFSRMLFVAEGLNKAQPEEFDELVSLGYAAGESNSWMKLLARPFLLRLRQIEKSSLAFARASESFQSDFAAGRIQAAPTLRDLALQKSRPLHIVRRIREYETPENRMLAAAAHTLLQHNLLPAAEKPLVNRWLDFLRMQGPLTAKEVRQVVSHLQAKKYAGPRSYYASALIMARLILSEAGIDLSQTNTVDAEPFLTNMPVLYEKYVRAVIAHHLQQRGYIVEKRETNLPTLFIDGACQMVPDIIIQREDSVALIADTKYKVLSPAEPIAQADYYQMAAYLEGFGAGKGMLILPNEYSDTAALVGRQTIQGKVVYELSIPLQDAEGAEAAIKEVIDQVLA